MLVTPMVRNNPIVAFRKAAITWGPERLRIRAWFKNARFRVTLGISARTLIGPALERVYATPG